MQTKRAMIRKRGKGSNRRIVKARLQNGIENEGGGENGHVR